MIKLMVLPILLSFFAGCGTTTGLSPNQAHSGFDDARTVSIRPHGNIPSGALNVMGTGIGAEWNEAKKDQVLLIIAVFNLTTGITGAELNIDGEKITLTPTAGVTDMDSGGSTMKISTRGFGTQLDTVEKIIQSKKTWLRVHTPTGTMENAVIDGDKDSKAYHALKRFMASVRGK